MRHKSRKILLIFSLFIVIALSHLTNRIHVSAQHNARPLHDANNVFQFRSVAWNPDGSEIAVSSTQGVYVYKPTSRTFAKFGDADTEMNVAAWSPDGNYLADVEFPAPSTVVIWNSGGQIIGSFQVNDLYIWTLAWSPDGKLLALGTDHGTLVLETRTFRPTISLNGSHDQIFGLSWRSDSRQIATLVVPGRVEIWNVTSGTLQRSFQIARYLDAVAWSPDGTKIATVGSRDLDCVSCTYGSLDPQIWNIYGVLYTTLHGHSDFVTAVKWSPNGKQLVTGSQDNTVIVWNMASRQKYAVLPINLQENSSGSLSTMLDWSPDGRYLVALNTDDHMQIWDVVAKKLEVDFTDEIFTDPSVF